MHAYVSVHVCVHALRGCVCTQGYVVHPCLCVCVWVYPLTSNITTSILYCNTETRWLEGYFEK